MMRSVFFRDPLQGAIGSWIFLDVGVVGLGYNVGHFWDNVLSRGFAYCHRPPNQDGPTELAPTEEVPELRNSSFPDVRQNRRKNEFSKRVFEESLTRSVPGEHT